MKWNYLSRDFTFTKQKKVFYLGKWIIVLENGEYAEETDFHEGNPVFLSNQLLSLGSGPNRSQRNALSLFK